MYIKSDNQKNNTKQSIINNQNMSVIILKTFRCLFTNHMVEQLVEFGQINYNEDTISFKEKWEEWILTNETMENIEKEKQNFILQGHYISNEEIIKKMYNSCRFYYLKQMKQIKEKNINRQENPPTTEKKKRKNYEKVGKEYLQEIDEFIILEMKNKEYFYQPICDGDGGDLKAVLSGNINNNDIKFNTISPAQSFLHYLDQYPEYKEETDEQKEKRKKTFKNRFYLFGKQLKIDK